MRLAIHSKERAKVAARPSQTRCKLNIPTTQRPPGGLLSGRSYGQSSPPKRRRSGFAPPGTERIRGLSDPQVRHHLRPARVNGARYLSLRAPLPSRGRSRIAATLVEPPVDPSVEGGSNPPASTPPGQVRLGVRPQPLGFMRPSILGPGPVVQPRERSTE